MYLPVYNIPTLLEVRMMKTVLVILLNLLSLSIRRQAMGFRQSAIGKLGQS